MPEKAVSVSLAGSASSPLNPDPAGAAEQRVLLYYRLVDAQSFSQLVELFSETVIYRRPGYQAIIGKDSLAAFYQSQRVIAVGQHAITELLAQGNKVAVHGEFNGILKNGNEVAVRFADFFRLTDDGLFECRDTFFFVPSV